MNWDQLKTILWLRWRLMRNQWARSKGIGAVIAAFVAAGVCLAGATSFALALAGGIMGMGQARAVVVWGTWCGLTVAFLFLWILGVLTELQRSQTIDLQSLMHLPVRLGQMFVINYLASHLTVSIVLFVPAMMGLTLGMAISRGPAMLLLAPLALGMVFMVTAWSYCLLGWLASLMSNPRRRRTIVMATMAVFILMAQAPNLYFNVFHRFSSPAKGATSDQARRQSDATKAEIHGTFDQITSVQEFIPPLWLPLGAQALVDGRLVPALLGTFGFCAIGALGLRRAYRSTLRFYLGESSAKAVAQIKPKPATAASQTPTKAGRRFLELRLPAVPEQAAAVALATFRSFLRAPEVKMAWGSSILATMVLGAMFLFRTQLKAPEAAKPFIATAAMVFSVFMLVQFFANQFGFDRDGFRALILSPSERRFILMGKNLACLPVGTGFGVILLVLVCARLGLSPFVFVAGLLQLAALLLLAALLGNVISILAPYRIQAGTMKPAKMPGLTMLLMMACHMLFPIAMAPAFIPPLAQFLWQKAGWPNAVPVNLILSAVLAALIAVTYWQTLGPLGRLLQRRETKILGVVTVEVE